MNQSDFFDLLYNGVEGEVRISLKGISEGRWFTWPSQREELLSYVEKHSNTDVYATTTTFSTRTRKAEYAEAGAVVYTDADTCAPTNFRLAPSIVLNTSPGHWQCFWLLDEPTTAEAVAEVSRAVTYAHVDQGCDKNGWMPTKVLRVPGTTHTKTDVHHTVTGEITGELYSLADFEQVYPASEVQARVEDSDLPSDLPDLFELTGKLPMDLWNLYHEKPEPGVELSARLWKLELELFRAGWTAPEVFVVAQASGSNKYHPDRVGETTASGSVRAHRSNPDGDLWKEVQQAERFAIENPNERVEVETGKTAVPLKAERPSFLSPQEEDFVASHKTFVDRYVEWVASRTDASPEYSRTWGYLLLSCVYGNRASIPTKWGDTKLNLWTLTLGETTITRKSTAKNLFLNVLHKFEAETGEDIDVGSDFSAEGLNKVLGTRDGKPSLVWRDEVQGFFKEMFTKNYLAGTVESLTDLYEGRVKVSLRATKGTSQTKRASVLFNMMLLGIEEETAEVLTNKNFRSGFLTRFLWTIASTPEMTADRIALQQRSEDDYRGEDPMVGEFVREFIAVLRKMPTSLTIYATPEMLERLNQWIGDALAMVKRSRNPKNMQPTVQRLAINIWKCAALLALHSRSERIELKHLLPVLKQAEEWYLALETMSNAIAASEFERQVNEVEGFILDGGGKRLKSAIYRKFPARPMFVNEWIEALIQQGRAEAQGQSIVLRKED